MEEPWRIGDPYVLAAAALVAVVLAAASVRVLREYERGIVFRLRLWVIDQEGPGPGAAHPGGGSHGARDPAHGHAANTALRT